MWNELSAGPTLVLQPPFYQTTWFYIACALLLCVLLWLVIRLRLRQMTEAMQGRLEERARERVRIARDLHDTLLQGIQGLVLRFHFATEQLPPAEPVRAMLAEALDRADQVIREGREKVTELRSEASSPAEIEKHLRKTAQALQADGPSRINLVVIGQPRSLRAAVQDELYSIGREALTNAMRHSGAKQIVLELEYGAQHFMLACRDNGRGVTPEVLATSSVQGHWGIIGMRERARSLGCKFEFSSVPWERHQDRSPRAGAQGVCKGFVAAALAWHAALRCFHRRGSDPRHARPAAMPIACRQPFRPTIRNHSSGD